VILTDADHLREALELVRQERDIARAAVLPVVEQAERLERERNYWRALATTAAERQRQACADFMSEQRWYTTLACLSAPLVTNKDEP
jgi:hypothetical protein